MTYRGQIKNGVVVLEGTPSLPEGAHVQLEVLEEKDIHELWEGLQKFAGTVQGPSDLAENHDHYAHGARKRDNS